MITPKNLTLVGIVFFSSLLCAENPIPDSTFPHIKCSYKKVTPDGNPLEQFLDEYAPYMAPGKTRSHDVWIGTPDRLVPLVFVTIDEDNCKDVFLRFEIPHRIDMDSKYSDDIHEAVKVRKELPFAAYHFVRNVSQKETVDIKLARWTLYHARLADAGKYGKLLCYNTNKENDRDCGCMTLVAFEECLKYYKPNDEAVKEREARLESLRAKREAEQKEKKEQVEK